LSHNDTFSVAGSKRSSTLTFVRKFWHLPPHYVAELEKIEVAGTKANPALGEQMANKTVQMTTGQYRHFVAVQYLNASNALFEGLKTQQGKNSFAAIHLAAIHHNSYDTGMTLA
jgi:hypothetical protein